MKADYSLKGKIDFAVITIRADENKAMLRRLPNRQIYEGSNRSYIISRLPLADNTEYLIAVIRSLEQGEGQAQDVARDAIEDLDPSWLLLVGIAGGVPANEFSLGDVVVATRLADFSVTAALEGRKAQLAVSGGPMHKQVQDKVALIAAMETEFGEWNTDQSLGMARPPVELTEEKFYGDDQWRTTVKESMTRHFESSVPLRPPRITTGAIASSDTLVKDSQLLQQWQEAARQVVAVEMELGGVYIAARRMNREYPILAIRGISDIVGFKRHPDWTEYACQSAAAFAHAFLVTQPIAPRTRANQDVTPSTDSSKPNVSRSGPAKYALDIAMATKYWDSKSLEQFAGSAGSRAALTSDDQPPSYLLPYLLDRSQQETQLIKALFERRAEKPKYPIVCVVHGDERECHADFLRKLRHILLPKTLSYWYPHEVLSSPIAYYDLQISLDKITGTNATDLLRDNLLTAVGITSASLSDVVSFIHQQHKLAVMINVTLLTENLSTSALKKISLFLEFWNEWEELPESLLLFICLDFKYQRAFQTKKRVLFWHRRFSNEDVRTFINNLDFTVYQRIFGFCLPELKSIPRSDLDAMIQIDLVHRFYRFKESDVRSLYGDTKLLDRHGRIPMETLIDSLDEIYRQRTVPVGA
jgi:nucleoside phosphorylase